MHFYPKNEKPSGNRIAFYPRNGKLGRFLVRFYPKNEKPGGVSVHLYPMNEITAIFSGTRVGRNSIRPTNGHANGQMNGKNGQDFYRPCRGV